MPTPTHPDVIVQLSGVDADQLDVTATVEKALHREVGAHAAGEFVADASRCTDLDTLLRLVHRTVDVI